MSQPAMPVEIQMPNPDLPEDITMDILSRLRVKSLSRFRCVSKPWLNLISNPRFVKLHLRRSISSETQRVLLSTTPLQSVDYTSDYAVTELDFPLGNPDRALEILGSCDGLVCLSDDEHIFVYNPSTRKLRELPKPHENLDDDDDEVVYGFGYDSLANDYKVVQVRTNGLDATRFTVFDLKGNSWRNCSGELSNCHDIEIDNGVFVNGSLHWLGYRDSGPEAFIVSLDLAREVFEEIPLPDYDKEKFKVSNLGVVGGFLYAKSSWGKSWETVTIDAWVMKEYGVKASWEKLITLPRRRVEGTIGFLNTLCFLGNGELLLAINCRKLGIYNAEKDVLRTAMVRDDFTAALYVESLVPPDGL